MPRLSVSLILFLLAACSTTTKAPMSLQIPAGPHHFEANNYIGQSPKLGPDSAPIKILTFSDFQCNHCRRFARTLEELRENYPQDIQLIYKSLPLPNHPEGQASALTAFAAYSQGKFWEMHDELFDHQSVLGSKLYGELAEELELDLNYFEQDKRSAFYRQMLQNDLKLAKQWQIYSTPRAFVNGEALSGAVSYSELEEAFLRQKARMKIQ